MDTEKDVAHGDLSAMVVSESVAGRHTVDDVRWTMFGGRCSVDEIGGVALSTATCWARPHLGSVETPLRSRETSSP
jgi:hypothetical protein